MRRRSALGLMAAMAGRAAALPSIRKFHTRKYTIGARDYLFLEVETDSGITGLGEGSLPFRVDIVEQAILWLEPHLVNQPVSGIEEQWNRIYHQLSRWRDGSVLMTALAAVDIALWDIEGKRLGEPCWRLAGASTPKPLRVYYSHWDHGLKERSERGWADWTAHSLEKGWTAAKWVLPRAATEAERIRQAVSDLEAIRKAAGDKIQIGLEMFETFSIRSAIEFARAVAPLKPWFIEEPVQRENPRMLAEVAAHSPVPVAAGEGLLTRWDFKQLFDVNGVRIAQPDVIHCGGITETRRVAALAETYGVEVSPHMWYGPIAHTASLAAIASARNFLAQEWDGASEALFTELTQGTLPKRTPGGVIPSSQPGLGLKLDWDQLAKRFPYQGRRASPQLTPKTPVPNPR